METTTYNHQEIEAKWQSIWEKDQLYKTPEDATHDNKYNILPQFPYPSGSGLHVGHAEVYTACDIMARFQRMKGKKVLHALGWDAFGLPAENYAIKTNVHPKKTISDAIANFKRQIQMLGISVDWSREIGTHTPEYYKWTQWLFLLMLKKGLAYRKEQNVNWCPGCQTVLANEQIEVGKCERCESEVVQRQMLQWFLKITDYADRLIDDLEKVDWPEESKKRQRDWIGRSVGATIKLKIQNSKLKIDFIEVFTTRPDTIYGVTFIALAPDGETTKNLISEMPEKEAVEKYASEIKFKTELERMADRSKTGVFTGLYAFHPITQKELPIYVADFVLGSVGTGAIMGVPGHDTRDFEFAKVLDLPITRVVSSNGEDMPINSVDDVYVEEGISVNSDFLSGLKTVEATKSVIEYLEDRGLGEKAVTYRLRDWSVSRQRFWGAPIPVVFDPENNPHPCHDDDLPVVLPDDVDFRPTGVSPLKYSPGFQNGVEEKYGKGWHREVDTLDTFVCSSWYYLRFIDPQNSAVFADKGLLETWLPVDFYLGGAEHVNGHLLYARFVAKVLFDEGLISCDEPFLKHRHQGIIWGSDGRIMSKRYGNIVNPVDVIEEYGADTLRMYEMFLGPMEASKPFSFEGIKGVYRFLQRVERFSRSVFAESPEIGDSTQQLINDATVNIEHFRFNVAIARLMETLNLYEKVTPSKVAWEQFLIILAPFAPHLTEEIWHLDHSQSIHLQSWPKAQEVINDIVTIPVQVNGKLRGIFEINREESENREVLEQKAAEIAVNYLKNGFIQSIVVPGKLVNFVVKS